MFYPGRYSGLMKDVNRRWENHMNRTPTPLEIQRQKQVENLKKFNPTIVELSRNEEFVLNITTNRETLSLRILLPEQFPQVKPIVIVSTPAQHPWISDHMHVVGSSDLNNFSIHSELGQIILGIVEEFHSNPPQILKIKGPMALPFSANSSKSSSESLSYSLSPVTNTSSALNAVYKPGSGKTVLHLPFPTHTTDSLMSEFPDLKRFSIEELQELQTNEDKFQEYVEHLPNIKKIHEDQERLYDENEELAKHNISKEPILEFNKKKLLESIDVVGNLRHKFDEFSQDYQMLSEQYLPTSIQDSLKFAALNAEDESEKIAEIFLEGKIEIEEFLSKFMEKRTLSHCRKAKEERLNQQLMELKKSGF